MGTLISFRSLATRRINLSQLSQTLVIYFGFALTGAGTTMLGSALPALAKRFSLGDVQGGYLFAAQFTCSTLGVLLSGRLTQRVGFKRTLITGFFLISAGISSLAWTPWPACMIAVGLYGMGLGIAIPTCNLKVAAHHSTRRASALNLLNFVWTAGALAWSPAAAAISARPISFLLVGGFVGAYTLCLLTLRSTESYVAPNTNEASVERFPFGVAAATATLFFLYVGVENAWAGWASSLAQRLDGASSNWMWAASLFWGALLTGRAFAPVFLNYISDEKLLLFDLMGATTAGCVLVVATSFKQCLVGLILAGFSLASAFPNMMARMTREFERRPGAVGWLFASASIGAAVLPWTVGLVSTRFGGLRLGLLVPLAACAVMLMIHIFRMRAVSSQANPSTLATIHSGSKA